RVLHGVVEPIGVPVVGRPPHAQHRCELLLHFRRRAERPGPVPGRVGRGSRRTRVLHVPGVDPCGPLVPPAQPGQPVRLRGSRGYRRRWIAPPPVTMSAPPRTRPGVACSPNATRPTSWLTTKKSTMKSPSSRLKSTVRLRLTKTPYVTSKQAPRTIHP